MSRLRAVRRVVNATVTSLVSTRHVALRTTYWRCPGFFGGGGAVSLSHGSMTCQPWAFHHSGPTSLLKGVIGMDGMGRCLSPFNTEASALRLLQLRLCRFVSVQSANISTANDASGSSEYIGPVPRRYSHQFHSHCHRVD